MALRSVVPLMPLTYAVRALRQVFIRGADLGLNPLNDGKLLRVPIPPLDEERRREMAKKIGKMLEEEKTALRNMRREAKEFIEELEKEKEITEDDAKALREECRTLQYVTFLVQPQGPPQYTLRAGDEKSRMIQVIGAQPSLFNIWSLDLELGRKRVRDLDSYRHVWATVHRGDRGAG